MRELMTVVFVLGVAAFLASLLFVGGMIGDVLWRAGIAAMLTVLAGMRLYVSRRRKHRTTTETEGEDSEA